MERRLSFAFLTVDIEKTNHFRADAFFDVENSEIGIFNNLVQATACATFLSIHAASGTIVTTNQIINNGLLR
ncbi:hypothetical protein D3C86_2207050 [compost metagenome]